MRKKLIILEMANNHNGLVSHGLEIIRKYRELVDGIEDFEFCFKFQLRDLDTFIRGDMAGNMEIPLIKRFEQTRISLDDLKLMIDEATNLGFSTMVTPFDEISAKNLDRLGVDYVKIASCSFNDWPLLEEIVKLGKPVVASCAGARQEDVDKVVDFFRNREVYMLLQHCVGEYPTAREAMNIGQIRYLADRYQGIDIGFSSHEDPESVDLAPLAYAQGAVSFEKHVALPTKEFGKNAYSTSPEEFRLWLNALIEAKRIIGPVRTRYSPSEHERSSLKRLKRGIFARRRLSAGEVLSPENVYLAFPPSDGQLLAQELGKHIELKVTKDLEINEPIGDCAVIKSDNSQLVVDAAEEIMNILKEARVGLPSFADLEISHHYGLERFNEVGLGMITVVNRQYCKKILVMIAGQEHPEQYHKVKEETFHVLWGEGEVYLDGKHKKLQAGNVVIIEPGVRHRMRTETGIVIEEISTNHEVDDSYYSDESITSNKRRKTYLAHWDLKKSTEK